MTEAAIRKTLTPYLSDGETLVWVGEPKKWLVFAAKDLPALFGGLLLLGLLFYGAKEMLSSAAMSFFYLWFLPVAATVLYAALGRFVLAALRRTHTIYGLTEQRILIQSGVLAKSLQTFYLPHFANLSVIEQADGRGTITFLPDQPATTDTNKLHSLEWIENVSSVYEKMIELQKK